MYRYYANKDVSIPKIFYNAYDQDGNEGILLMEDLTPTHSHMADWEVPIDLNKLTSIIEVISQFHAASWGRVEQFAVPSHLESTEEYLKHIDYLERDYMHFRENQTYNFGNHCEVYEESLLYLRKNAPKHIKRINNKQHSTFIHGDLNVCNMLYPLISHAKPCIIDLEAVRIGLCTEDLVMLFIHDLFHGWEESLSIFQMYYRSICSKIPCDYRYDQFMEDIRVSLMEGIFFPLKLFVHNGIEDEELVMKSINAYRALMGLTSENA